MSCSSVAIPKPSTPSSSSSFLTHRLLYRGALCLPDSHMVLDGITFCAQIDSRHSSHTPNGTTLLENPLALALESMRGRPTLRFLGTVKLSDVWMDESGGLLMDIHPRAMLTRIYFENIFCLGMSAGKVMQDVLRPTAGQDKGKGKEDVVLPEMSELGVKVALGDTDGPETTYMVIFAKLQHIAAGQQDARTIQLVVARLTTQPSGPRSRPRLPRPDDPIPRKPPLLLGLNKPGIRELKKVDRSSDGARELKRATSVGNGLASNPKRQKLETRGGQNGSANALFKVPDVPPKTTCVKGKGKATHLDADVFGLMVANGEVTDDVENGEVERMNKNVVKKATLDFLAKTKDPCKASFVNRSHPEFKETFQWVYRGVSFALNKRARMKTTPVELPVVQRLVKSHSEMYVGGYGGLSPSMDSTERQKHSVIAFSEL